MRALATVQTFPLGVDVSWVFNIIRQQRKYSYIKIIPSYEDNSCILGQNK